MKLFNISFLFKDWKNSLLNLYKLNVLNLKDIFKVCSFMLLVVLLEAVCVTAFIPLFEFLQNNQQPVSNNPSKWLTTIRIYSIFLT